VQTDELAESFPLMDPWNGLDMVDRFFGNFMRNPISRLASAEVHEPAMELYETKNELVAYIYAPGLSQESIDLTASDHGFMIKAEGKSRLEISPDLVTHTPWRNHATQTSTLSASYTLPVEINPSKANASYQDGVLAIRLPKSEAAKPQTVKVAVNGRKS